MVSQDWSGLSIIGKVERFLVIHGLRVHGLRETEGTKRWFGSVWTKREQIVAKQHSKCSWQIFSPTKRGRAGVEIGSEQLYISLLEFRFAWQKADLGPKVVPHMEKAKKAAEAAWLAIPRASQVPATWCIGSSESSLLISRFSFFSVDQIDLFVLQTNQKTTLRVKWYKSLCSILKY